MTANNTKTPLPNGRGRETYGAAVSRTGEGAFSPTAGKSTLTRYANAKGVSFATSPIKGEVNRHIQNARSLRVNMTNAERKLWRLLRTEPFTAWKFRRQHPIDSYIADFACVETRLIIEADGGQHCDNLKDTERTAWLEKHGWHVVRFWNNEVLQNPEGIAQVLHAELCSLTPAPGTSTLTRYANARGISFATSPVKGEVNIR